MTRIHNIQPLERAWANLFVRLVFLILTSHAITVTIADRVADKIYSTLQSNHYCSRRLNATHQVGCQSDLGGNLGIVWIVEESADLDHVLKMGTTPPYMAILKKSFMSRKVILEFKNNPGRVSGVVFLDNEHDDSKSRSTPFSPDDICPNRYSGLYVNDTEYGECKHAWQEESPVSGLLYDDIPFPIFLINEKKSIDSIESCFKENNVIISESKDDKKITKTQAPYPLCGVQLDSFMMAAKDTHFCLNSHFVIDEILQTNSRRCYPVDNQNVFAYYKPAIGPLHPINGTATQKPDVADPQSVVLLVAKLSSISMFSEISPGADSTLTSIITLLAIAEALGRVRNSTDVVKSKRNIAFAIIDSEPFDYTGSNRIIHSMLQGTFPYGYYRHSNQSNAIQNLNLSSIDYIINLDQLASYPLSESIHFHSDPRESSDNNAKLDKIYKVMQRLSSSMDVKLERESNLPLPPTSLQEFIRQGRASGNGDDKFAGLVLSNYGKTYKNLLYHSIYDDSHNIYQTSRAKQLQHLVQVASLIARTVYEITFGGEMDRSEEVTVDTEIVDQLLDCYLKDAQCHLFTRACRAGQKMPSGPIPTYKDPTKRSDDMNGAITANLLAYFIGEKVKEFNFSKCHEENYASLTYSYQYINDRDDPIDNVSLGVCIRSQVLMLSSDSPAYNISNDEITLDPKYPAWTVSLSSIRTPVRLYLIPSPLSQWCLFLLGIVVTLASFVIVYYVRDNLNPSSSNNDLQTATPT